MNAQRVYVRSEADSGDIPPAYQRGIVVDLFDDKAASTVQNNLEEIVRLVGEPSAEALDLLLFSAGVYVADKKTARSNADDAWSRSFTLRSPVADKDLWTGQAGALSSALAFLTGDRWALSFRQKRSVLPRRRTPGTELYETVCLFSGGLDSLAGAVHLLATTKGRVLLVGHHDSGQTQTTQVELAGRLADQFGRSRVDLLTMLLRPSPRSAQQEYPLPETRELTTRSRSLTFVALGLAAASALGPDVPLWIPENGYISLNVPVTGARLGSCSTRTTHPHFLAQLRRLLGALGIGNPLVNPFGAMTKGEILRNSPRQDVLGRLAPFSISCAHPEANRYNSDPERRAPGNCGYCYPCLIRRASMHVMGWDRGGTYLYDVLRDPALLARGSGDRGKDARAVLSGLADPQALATSPLAILRGGPIPAGTDLNELAAMYLRGRNELRAFFAEATRAVKRAAGLV